MQHKTWKQKEEVDHCGGLYLEASLSYWQKAVSKEGGTVCALPSPVPGTE